MICPHCGQNSSGSDWILDDGSGGLVAWGDLDDGGADFDSYEAATCPECSVAVYIDDLVAANS